MATRLRGCGIYWLIFGRRHWRPLLIAARQVVYDSLAIVTEFRMRYKTWRSNWATCLRCGRRFNSWFDVGCCVWSEPGRPELTGECGACARAK